MKRGILILLLAFCALFMISSVCASDVDDMLMASENTQAIGEVQNDVISVVDDNQPIQQTDDKEIISEGEVGTFTDLRNKIANAHGGDTVTLDMDYEADESGEISFAKSITIDGKGHTIDAKGKTRVFQVQANNVIIKNLNIINANGNGEGGAILFENPGTVKNCNFTNNTASTEGGAIWMYSGTVENCNFTNNKATGSDDSDGGAISFYNQGTVTNCNFNNNKVTGEYGYGGAIFFKGSVGSVKNCNFINNFANIEGGAIYFDEDSTASVMDSYFTNNIASINGGGIYFHHGKATNCYFKNNYGFNGGAIFVMNYGSADSCILKTSEDTIYNGYILPPTLNVENFTTYSNSGEKLTFDLKTNSNMQINNGNITINVYHTNNNSEVGSYSCLSGQGWDVYLPAGTYYAVFKTEYEEFEPVNRTIKVVGTDDKSFIGLNYIINSNDDPVINLTSDYYYDSEYNARFIKGIIINKNVTINGNGFTIDCKGLARAFNVQATNVTIKNLTIKNAKCNEDGGAIHFNSFGTVINCNFTNNTASNRGGAIWMNSGNVINCNFVNNTASYGGAIAGSASNVEISNCSFINNTANDIGGAVYVFESENWTFTGCSFKDNHADTHGGALGLINCENCVVSECSFTHNTAEEGGGAIVEIDGANNTISGCIFENNSANSYVGAVYGTRSNDTVITHCTFINNTGADAGAIYQNSCKNGTVSYCNFINNSANSKTSTTGGAILWDGGGNTTISYCNFTGNSATKGLAITMKNSDDNLVSNCRFVNNSGDLKSSCGTIYWDASHNGVVSDCYFEGNTGKETGGIYWHYSHYGTVSDCKFKNNTATYGGAVQIERSDKFAITNCEFENNTAKSGGALYVYYGQNYQVSNCEFKNNTAEYGGAITWSNHDNGIVSNSKFENNTCKGESDQYGGAIYWVNSKNSVVSNSIFIGNNGKNGGALHYKSDNGTVIDCIFVNNTADNGIIYVESMEYRKNFKANNNIFLNNNGQAITISESYETINTNYNWFGHNATNYKECNDSTEGTFDTWLFLNATANPIEITLSNKTTITFNLYAYNSTSKSISDAHAVMPINLTITTTSGSVDKDIVGLGETITFTPNAPGTIGITAKIENITDTVKIDVYEGLFEELQNIINNAAEGSIIILEKDYTFNKGFSTEGIVIDKSIIIDGNGHTLNGNNMARIFKINSNNVILENINFINGYVKDTEYGGAVHALNHGYIAIFNCNFTNNHAGCFGGAIDLFKCHYCYISDCNFENNTVSQSAGAICESECNNCTISGCDFKNNGARQFAGAVRMKQSNDCSIFDCNFEDNYVKFESSPRDGGAIDWEGDNGQISGCIFTNNTAERAGAICWSGNNGHISDCIFKNNDASIKGGAIYFINPNKNYPISNCIFINNTAGENGGAISNGNAVNCIFSENNAMEGGAMYGGTADSCIFKTSTDTTVGTTILSPILTVENLTAGFNSSAKVKTNFTTSSGIPLDNTNISISLYYKENNTWVGNYSCISGEGWTVDLPRGTYVAVFNTEYAGFTPVNATVTVIKGNSTLTVPDITFDYGSTGSATVNITNAIGIIAEVTGHSEAIVTVKDNVITVSNLTAGTYTLNVTTITSDDYNNVSKTANITVNKLNTEITAVNNAYVINYGGTYAVTLKDANGNALAGQKVTFTLNGKNIGTAVTNAQGAASIKLTAAALKTAKAGTKNLVIKFAGDSNYVTASKTVKITINKEKTKIAAKKKTFKKTKKVKKYTITLKNSKNKAVKKVQLTLKVKGKTYKVKTNAKGKATFKIKNLKKKGTFKATIKFKGNKYYKAATKKVKIKIK